MDDDQPPDLAIKLSPQAGTAGCMICVAFTQVFHGPELYLADRNGLVCWDCGFKYAPELVRMLGWYWKRRAEARGG